jgi:hypothetical protein
MVLGGDITADSTPIMVKPRAIVNMFSHDSPNKQHLDTQQSNQSCLGGYF